MRYRVVIEAVRYATYTIEADCEDNAIEHAMELLDNEDVEYDISVTEQKDQI